MDDKVCPIKQAAGVFVLLNQGRAVDMHDMACIRYRCAWWNDDFGECAIMALAKTQTVPFVVRELQAEVRGR